MNKILILLLLLSLYNVISLGRSERQELKLVHTNNIQSKDVRVKRALASAIKSGISLLAEATTTLIKQYKGNAKTAANIAYSVVEKIPVIGDLVGLLFDNSDEESEINSLLTKINDNLHVLTQEVNNIETKVNQLSQQLDLSLVQSQVATDTREIKNCHADLLLFLKNPSLPSAKDRLVKCYDKFGYVREIGRILNNEKLTFLQQPLFDQIKKAKGYCDGITLNEVYKYLLGIYIEGCNALVAAEALKYKHEQSTYQTECKNTIRKSETYLNALYDQCTKEPCDNILPVMRSLGSGSDVTQMITKAKETFPWFEFVILMFKEGTRVDEDFVGSINRNVLTSKGSTFRIIIWSPSANKYSSGTQYGVEYNENSLHAKYNGMRLIETSRHGKIFLVGYNSVVTSVCSQKTTFDPTAYSHARILHGKMAYMLVLLNAVLIRALL